MPLTGEEVEETITSLRKDGKSMAAIGLILRDQYGIPSVKLSTGKSVKEILANNNLERRLPEDMSALMKKAVRLKEHLYRNSKDLHNKRGLNLVEAKIRRLEKYYRSRGNLPEGWKYSIDRAKLEVE